MKADLKRMKHERHRANKLLESVSKDATGEQHAIENLELELEKRKARLRSLGERRNHFKSIVANYDALMHIEDEIENPSAGVVGQNGPVG